MLLSPSAESPVALTIEERARVKNVKLRINPVTIPNGRFLPPSREPDKTMGNTGKIHGERIVTSPAINAKKTKSIILFGIGD
jgi:hypothetical protein